MNSIWNKNKSVFYTRFPELAQFLTQEMTAFEEKHTPLFEIQNAKNGSPIAFENNLPLHSKYNPQREAEQLVSSFDKNASTAAVFFSFGLGYAPILFAEKFSATPILIVEPDSAHLFEAFSIFDWDAVLSHKELIFAIGATVEETASIIDRYGITSCKFFSVPAQTAHAASFYTELNEQLARRKQKAEINTNTLEKFSHLWLHNSCTNLPYLAELDGVEKYHDCTTLPVLILAAGPSLSSVLPYLAELKKRSIIVCVDTALHACLRTGIEPDFIILVDPQYACALHLEFLSSPSSVLITESAAYPSVFRFCCKEKVLCSSLFPLGQYFEKQLGNKGKLGAGGSVTTTAWDFARLCGTKEIYLAGMDLGFPSKQTHIRGSQFEERAHRTASRISPAETDAVSSLLSANPTLEKDYDGNPLLTDERMSLFSWWFEKNCAQAEKSGVKTYTLTPQSLAIPGIHKACLSDMITRSEEEQARAAFFAKAAERSPLLRPSNALLYEAVLESFTQDLTSLTRLAKKGICLCEETFADRTRVQATAAALEKLDSEILSSKSKDAAALVFPTERQLSQEAASLPKDSVLSSFYYSRLIYQRLLSAAKEYLTTLKNCQK